MLTRHERVVVKPNRSRRGVPAALCHPHRALVGTGPTDWRVGGGGASRRGPFPERPDGCGEGRPARGVQRRDAYGGRRIRRLLLACGGGYGCHDEGADTVGMGAGPPSGPARLCRELRDRCGSGPARPAVRHGEQCPANGNDGAAPPWWTASAVRRPFASPHGCWRPGGRGHHIPSPSRSNIASKARSRGVCGSAEVG